MTSVTIPESVQSINQDAFSYCENLTSVDIPYGVTSIGVQAFIGCSALTSVNIPNSVTNIGNAAFSYCESLRLATIPAMVNISDRVFWCCYNLTSVVSLIENPSALTDVFHSISDDATLYVPQGTKSQYQAVNGWDFKNIVESGDPVTVSIADASGLATYCPVVGVDFNNSADIAAYKASVDNNIVTLTRVYKVAAGEGVLIRSLNDNAVNDADVLIDIEATKSADNAFVGTLTAKTLSEKDGSITNFVLSKNKDGVVGFYKANNTPIAAGKAYLPVANYDAEAGARGLTLVFDDGNTTSISEINNATTADNAIYTLSGARVKTPAKGLYIKNGKKVIVK